MDFPTVRELSRQKNAVRILKFLRDSKEEKTFTDVYTALDANDITVFIWMKKLQRLGLLKSARSRAHRNRIYYSIVNVKDVEWIIERFHWNIGFKLARLVPYERIAEEKVRVDKRFRALCEEYYLTLDEGIEAVKKCPKIGVEKARARIGHPFERTYLHRKEQGFDKPERTREQIMEEAKKAIG